MAHKLRPFLFVLGLTLTLLALGRSVRADECIDDQYTWIDYGTCCIYPFDPPVTQLWQAQCVDGSWTVTGETKCLRGELCAS